jgi:hypothetical protein
MNIKKFDYLIIAFIISTLALSFEAYICKYGLSTYCEIYFLENMWEENGLVEILQFLFLIIAIGYLIIIIRNHKDKLNKFICIFLIVNIFGLLYYAGEEISWGQHFFNWKTPEILQQLNNQKETNLHNISNLFDQLPRTLVMLWCSTSVFFVILIKKFYSLNDLIYQIVNPNKKLLIVSTLLIFFLIPDIIVDKFDLHSGYVTPQGIDIPEAKFWDLVSLNFIRLSELHEYIFSFYFFLYSIMLKEGIKRNILNI